MSEIKAHLMDWSRIGVDHRRFWRISPTKLSDLRLSSHEVQELFSLAARLVETRRMTRSLSIIIDHPSDRPCSISVSSCREVTILKYLQDNEFEELSPLQDWTIWFLTIDTCGFYSGRFSDPQRDKH